MEKIKIDPYFLVVGMILFSLVFLEAYLMPLTHDELSTIGCSHQSIIDIVTYRDPIPNNHILNTLLLKLQIYLFGDQLITNRLPNILAFMLYYVFSVRLAYILCKDMMTRWTLVILMTMQALLIDFFTVSRGYGLSLSFLVVSLYYMVQYLSTYRLVSLIATIIFAAIGVIASFTLLNYYIPLVCILGLHILMGNTKNQQIGEKYTKIAWLISITVGLATLCYLPFKKMMNTNQFQYWGNKSFFEDTVAELIYSLRSGVGYFPWNKIEYALVICFIFLCIIGAGIFSYTKNRKNQHIYIFFIGLFVLMILYNNLQHYLAEVPFLNARTALFFIPITSIVIVLSIQMIGTKKDALSVILMSFFIMINLQHFIRANNPRANFEWYQDGETHDVLRQINNIIMQYNMAQPVKIDCNWIFHPSLSYHIEHDFKGIMQLLPYHKNTDPESQATFYYVESSETESLKEKFIPVKDYNWKTKFVMIKK